MKNSYFNHAADFAWLGLDNIENIKVDNVLSKTNCADEVMSAYELLKVLTNPNYFHLLIKEIMNIQLLPIQNCIIQELWFRKFPMYIASRGFGKSFLTALLCVLKCLLIPGMKVVITGAGFRQAKLVFEYIEQIWSNAPILRDICSNESGPYKESDRWTFKINSSRCVAIPIGTGDKIRGLRANLLINDEFNSIDPAIYETVVRGFTSVQANPIEQVIAAARRQFLMKEGSWTEEHQKYYDGMIGNQSIISGTAGYDFQHFAAYWKRYHKIISGDRRSLQEMVGEELVDKFDPSDFSIIRIPFELIPEGFMDEKQVIQAKATVHSGVYASEYGCIFVKDSDGFFRRTLIESCVGAEKNNIHKNCGKVVFEPKLSGDPKKKYVIAVDPASESDNLALVVIELHDDHWRIVYCWTTNKKEHSKQVKAGRTEQENYYAYCARKVRDLMGLFPTVRIGIDSQGGGIALIEALHDKAIVAEGEELLWPIIDKDKPADTDTKDGAHIIERINFASGEWTAEANHGLRKDLEMKYCLFPRYDAVSLTLAAENDMEKMKEGVSFESLESVYMEIEELKNELTTIIMTQTGVTGRDRWDVPEVKLANGKKGRLRKDRYSALVMANMIARSMSRSEPALKYAVIGGTAKDLSTAKKTKNDQMYQGNQLYRPDPAFFVVVNRNR